MRAIKAVLLGVIVMASVIAPLAFAYRSQQKIGERSELLRQQSERLAGFSAENQRLSEQLARTEGPSLTRNQLRETLRLRGEVGQLYQAVREMDKLRAINKQLLAARGRTIAGEDPAAPDPGTVEAHWTKEQLGFAGYADPASGLKSALWAMSLGDANALAKSVTPETKNRLSREGWNDRRSSDEEIARSAKDIAESLSAARGFSVVAQNMVAEELAILAVYFEGEGQTRRIAMKKVGGEWKFNMMGRGGDSDDDLQNGHVAWP